MVGCGQDNLRKVSTAIMHHRWREVHLVYRVAVQATVVRGQVVIEPVIVIHSAVK